MGVGEPVVAQRFAYRERILRPEGAIDYDDALASGWEDWSWDSAVNLQSTAVVQQGQVELVQKK